VPGKEASSVASTAGFFHIARQVLPMLSSKAARPGEYGLTEREKQVLELMAEGMT